MKEGTRRNVKYIGCGLLVAALTFYFMFLTFPFSTLQERLLSRLAVPPPFSITVGDVQATPFLWLRFSDVTIQEDTTPKAALVAQIDQIRVRPSLLRLVTGKLYLKFRATLYGGTVKGLIGGERESRDISLSWKGLRLEQYGSIPVLKGARLAGLLSGKGALKMTGNNWTSSQGTLSGDLSRGSVEDLSVYGFSVPGLQGLTATLRVQLEQKKATLEALSVEADDLKFFLAGNADLLPRLSSSRLDVKGRVKLAGELANQYQVILAGFLRNQDSDGFSTFSLKGTLQNPRLAP